MNLKKTKIFVIVLLLFFNVSSFTQTEEYIVKAVFIEKLTRFITWPSNSQLNDSITPFIISVFGEDPIYSILLQLYSNREIKNKSVEVRLISRIDEIKDCNLLFISPTDNQSLNEIINYTKKNSILTISNTGGYGKTGVLINFVTIKKQIQFEINKTAVMKSGFQFSYLLFSEGIIIE